MKRAHVLTVIATLLVISVIVAACYTNPLTKRKEFMLFSPQEEVSLGIATFDTLKRQTPISTDPQQVEAVRRVGQRIASAVTLPGAQWEFVCFKDDNTANAFCLPGGKIGVYTGILPLTQDDNGLAVVLGHEVSHAVARHGGERMSQQLALQLGGVGLAVALQQQPQLTQQLAMAAYGVGTTVGVALPFSRQEESEADHMGLLTMAKAGYNPQNAITFWQRFKAYSDAHGGQPPAFLSDHPLDSKRIADLQKELPEAQKLYTGR
ncbi:MAG TPA: M48 family metallopeptidase [bacterium]